MSTTTTTTTNPDGSTTYMVTQERSPNWVQRFEHWPLVWKVLTAWSGLWMIIWFASVIYYNTGYRAVAADYGIGNYATYRGEATVMFVLSLLCVIGCGIAVYLTRKRSIKNPATVSAPLVESYSPTPESLPVA